MSVDVSLRSKKRITVRRSCELQFSREIFHDLVGIPDLPGAYKNHAIAICRRRRAATVPCSRCHCCRRCRRRRCAAVTPPPLYC